MLTTREAAQRLGLKTTGAVRQLILAGRLQAEKRGRDWFISEDDIEHFEQEPRKVGRPKSKIAHDIAQSEHRSSAERDEEPH